MAAVAGLPLLACATNPGLTVTFMLWALSGTCTAYQVQVVAEFVELISPSIRAQGIGLASAGLLAAQGIGLLLGGVLAQIGTAPLAITVAGATATFLGSALALARKLEYTRRPRE